MSIAQKLLQLTSIIYTSQNIPDILQVMVDAIAMEIAAADLVGCFIRESDTMYLGQFTNVPGDKELIRTLVIDIKEDGFAREIEETRRPVYIPSVTLDARVDATKRDSLSIQSIFGIPLLVGHHVYGLIFVHNMGKSMNLTQEQQQIAESLSNIAGTAIHTIRVLHRQSCVNRVASRLAAAKSITEIAQACADYVDQVSGASLVTVYRLQNASMHTGMSTTISASSSTFSYTFETLIRNHPSFSTTISSHHSVAFHTLQDQHPIDMQLREHFDIKCLIIFPVLKQDELLGLLIIAPVGVCRLHHTEELAALQSVADTAGVAMSNVIHSEELESLISTRTEELRKSIQELTAQEITLRGLIDAIPLSIILTDDEGRWLEANRVALAWFGLIDVPYRSKTTDELLAFCQSNHDILQHMAARRTHGVPQYHEDEYERMGTTSIVYKTYQSPIFAETNTVQGSVYIGEDLSEQRRMQMALYRSERLSSVGQLAAGVAHEIRNPLTAIRGFLQLLLADGANPRYCTLMIEEVDRLNTITKDFIFFAKPTPPKRTTVNIQDVLSAVSFLLLPEAHLLQLEMTLDVTDPLPTVWCDQDQVMQVLINLIHNAMEAAAPKGLILISAFHSDETKELVIRIRDNGIGITPERLERLGEPFYTTKEKGTGLGLMTCFKIVELHGWTLRIDSTVGHGTLAEIVIPIP